VALLEKALDVEPLGEDHREASAFLTDFAVSFRYPGRSAAASEAREARRLCRAFRKAARAALGLKG